MWTVARCALLALNFLLLSSQSYLLATALVTLLNIALVVIWDFAGSADARRRVTAAGPLAIAIVAAPYGIVLWAPMLMPYLLHTCRSGRAAPLANRRHHGHRCRTLPPDS